MQRQCSAEKDVNAFRVFYHIWRRGFSISPDLVHEETAVCNAGPAWVTTLIFQSVSCLITHGGISRPTGVSLLRLKHNGVNPVSRLAFKRFILIMCCGGGQRSAGLLAISSARLRAILYGHRLIRGLCLRAPQESII